LTALKIIAILNPSLQLIILERYFSMNDMKATITTKKDRNGKQSWQAAVSIPGLFKSAKLEKTDGTSNFATRGAAIQAVHTLAKKLNCRLATTGEKKIAAKKSIKT